jgi:hypothetical protein
MILVQIVVLLKLEFDIQQTNLRGQFVEQKIILISRLECDQIYKFWRYDFGHTLLCCLS